MAKYTTSIELEIDVPFELDPKKEFKIEGETIAELKQNIADLQKEIADEFGVTIDKVRQKNSKIGKVAKIFA